MSRPQLLFMASPGQLSVYDLTKAPPALNEELGDRQRLIATVSTIAEIQSKLANFHRERIETGALFGEERFQNSNDRADRALIRDLKTVREQLSEVTIKRGDNRPKLRHFHSLIGRAIFVRYLEDREILVPAYFEKVASRRKEWLKLLEEQPTTVLEPRIAKLRFLRVLKDREFTYALFDQLAEDFNGDTFPVDDEAAYIQQEHLDKLRGFLQGNTSPQKELFFFAYRFDLIPIELISAIYEEFYNEQTGKDRNQGSHYTPPVLVEFVLAHTLTPDVLAAKPRVMDPACGSGIFLVESFRRMVRHLWAQQEGRRVSRPQLRKILREQIAGMDINEEAVRVAAFSLYLAFLHYQEPREINAERRLPYLKWVPREMKSQREEKKPGADFFDVLLHANSFEVVSEKFPTEVAHRFGSGSATVVVGNPPWGYPKKEDEYGQKALAETVRWCDVKKGRPIGDMELSQAFIHLTQELLQEGGKAGLLISSGVFFKHHKNSRNFRRAWLKSAQLKQVVNFAHVRQIFFSGSEREAQGISPFASVVFEKMSGGAPADSRFQYWSAKRTAAIENTQCVILNRGDMHWLFQRDCLEYEKLWKIYWWGGHRDEALIRRLEHLPRLGNLSLTLPKVKLFCRQGFTKSKRDRKPSPDWFLKYKEYPAGKFESYGPLNKRWLIPVPTAVKRPGSEEVYRGTRLLIGRGVGKAQITARLETQPFAFRNSVNAFRLKGFEPWQEKTLLGIFWSSIAKYYFFETLGSWLWHDEIHRSNVIELPVCFPTDATLRNKIMGIVDELQKFDLKSEELELFRKEITSPNQLPRLEHQLDEAIFDLYELNPTERDLIRDMCSEGLDLFYRNRNSDALKKTVRPNTDIGTFEAVAQAEEGLSSYLQTFLKVWNEELAPDGELIWRVLSPPTNAPLLAVHFRTRYKKKNRVLEIGHEDVTGWDQLMEKLAEDCLIPAGCSQIFIDTFFQHVTDRDILFIKRDERRFWTRTAAREDAESAMTQLMNQEETVRGGGG